MIKEINKEQRKGLDYIVSRVNDIYDEDDLKEVVALSKELIKTQDLEHSQIVKLVTAFKEELSEEAVRFIGQKHFSPPQMAEIISVLKWHKEDAEGILSLLQKGAFYTMPSILAVLKVLLNESLGGGLELALDVLPKLKEGLEELSKKDEDSFIAIIEEVGILSSKDLPVVAMESFIGFILPLLKDDRAKTPSTSKYVYGKGLQQTKPEPVNKLWKIERYRYSLNRIADRKCGHGEMPVSLAYADSWASKRLTCIAKDTPFSKEEIKEQLKFVAEAQHVRYSK